MHRVVGLSACILSLACRTQPSAPSATPSSTVTRTSTPPPEPGAELGPDVVAMVDGRPIPTAKLDILLAAVQRDRLESGETLSAQQEARERAELVNALVYSELLRVECERLGISDEAVLTAYGGPLPNFTPSGDGYADAIDLYREAVIAQELGLLAVSNAEILAEYERQKVEWTSDQPWLAIHLVARRWDQPIGVEACDRYVSSYRRCVDEHIPKAAKGVMVDALNQTVEAWTEVARGPEREMLTSACTMALEAAQQATQSMGCDWSSSGKATSTGKQAARLEIVEIRKALARRGVDVPSEAQKQGWIASEEPQLVALDRLGPPIAKVAAKLKIGAVSQPIEHAGAFWLVHIERRWPAGALPLEARRSELVDFLTTQRFDRVHEELPARLRKAHRVVIR